jgi:quercetin dioxygenase-like cupin family protein
MEALVMTRSDLSSWRSPILATLCVIILACLSIVPAAGYDLVAPAGVQTGFLVARSEVAAPDGGETVVYLAHDRLDAGGTSGWHSHPGDATIAVAAGVLSLYRSSDPTCTGTPIPAGAGFEVPAGAVYVTRNEGSQAVEAYAFYSLPAGSDDDDVELGPPEFHGGTSDLANPACPF